MFSFNPYSIPTLVISFFLFSLGILVFLKNKGKPANRSLFYMCFSTAVWLFFESIAYNLTDENLANIFMRISYLGVTFIAITMFHFIYNFLNLMKCRRFIIVFYCLGIFESISILYGNLIIKGVKKYFWGYYPLAGSFHLVFLILFISLIVTCVILLILSYLKTQTLSIRKQQIKYVLFAIFVFDFSSVDFIANYGISWYPSGYLTTTFLLVVITYSIIKYRLLNITELITKTGIFIAVYSLVLGIPFAIAFGWQEKIEGLFGDNWWIVPLLISTLLATIGPFIYLYIQKRAEDTLLQEQRKYQTTLRQASSGMGRIKDLKQLLNLIVHIVTRAVHLEHSAVYLFEPMNKRFILGASRWRKETLKDIEKIENDSPLVEHLFKTHEPIVYEEIKQQTQDFGDRKLAQVELVLKNLDAAVVVPSFIENRLLGLLALGKKKSGKLYSASDLDVFTILANQAALAIENAQFYEDMKRTHEQLFKAEKMATIGTMADGLSHQINNRLHAMGFIAGDALDSIHLKKEAAASTEIKELLHDLEFALTRIQENVKQGGEVVQGLLKYTRKGDQGLSAVELDKLLHSAFEMAQFKIKLNMLSVVRDYPKDLPKLKGNFTQLQEVFFNLIDNAYDAMMQRKTEKHESDYTPQLKISAVPSGSIVNITVADNGIGVKKDDLDKLFTPFFTTKLSSKKGTGLGLYVIRKLIEDNHEGRVTFASEYMKGTRFLIQLPIFI